MSDLPAAIPAGVVPCPSGLSLTRGLEAAQAQHSGNISSPHTDLRLEATAPFDLESTFSCGQIFRWRREGEWWCGTLGGTALAVRASGGEIEVKQAGEPLTEAEIGRFLGLADDLPPIYRQIGTDRVMRAAIAALSGLRILRQEPWECLAGFICSAWNNVPKIQGSTGQLCRRWGEPLVLDLDDGEIVLHTFPSPERLASATEGELREAALGFRAPNLLKAARLVAEGRLDFEALRRAPYEEALRTLRDVPGVGRKVADCILLFSLDKPEAFPVDVWVWRVMREVYGRHLSEVLPAEPPAGGSGPSDRAYRAIQSFAWGRWGRCAGYAQQYLFTAKRQGLI